MVVSLYVIPVEELMDPLPMEGGDPQETAVTVIGELRLEQLEEEAVFIYIASCTA